LGLQWFEIFHKKPAPFAGVIFFYQNYLLFANLFSSLLIWPINQSINNPINLQEYYI